MSVASRKAMAEAVAKAQAEGSFDHGAVSSLADDDARRAEDLKTFFRQIEIYHDASPFVAQLWKKAKKRKKKWEPTDEEMTLFFATVREVRRRAKSKESVADLFIYEDRLDLPSSLDDESFDLLD